MVGRTSSQRRSGGLHNVRHASAPWLGKTRGGWPRVHRAFTALAAAHGKPISRRKSDPASTPCVVAGWAGPCSCWAAWSAQWRRAWARGPAGRCGGRRPAPDSGCLGPRGGEHQVAGGAARAEAQDGEGTHEEAPGPAVPARALGRRLCNTRHAHVHTLGSERYSTDARQRSN